MKVMSPQGMGLLRYCSVFYRLLGPTPRTRHYGVDYGAYMHDVARDIGAAPSLATWVWRCPRTAVAYALGQAYITFFRLEGPFRDDLAPAISRGELFRPVAARPWAANAAFVAIIVLFAAVNGFLWVLDALGWALGLTGRGDDR